MVLFASFPRSPLEQSQCGLCDCRCIRPPNGWVAPDLNIVTFADRPPPKVERVIITPALVRA